MWEPRPSAGRLHHKSISFPEVGSGREWLTIQSILCMAVQCSAALCCAELSGGGHIEGGGGRINTSTAKFSESILASIFSCLLSCVFTAKQFTVLFWTSSHSFLASQFLPHSLQTSSKAYTPFFHYSKSLSSGLSLFHKQLIQKRTFFRFQHIPFIHRQKCTSKSPPPPSSPWVSPPTVV